MSTAPAASNTGDPIRQWAAGSLGLSPDAAPADAKQAFWRLLSDEDFVPPEFAHSAARLLVARSPLDRAPVEPCEAASRHVGERLKDEVEQFARSFFQRSAAERANRGKELWSRCQDQPMLLEWLRGLALGGRVEPKPLRDAPEHVAELVSRVQELFVLRPGQRACARQSRLAEIVDKAGPDGMRGWEEAAVYLRQSAPDLAALEPDLVDRLAGWSERERRRQRAQAFGRVSKSRAERREKVRVFSTSPTYTDLVLRAIAMLATIGSFCFFMFERDNFAPRSRNAARSGQFQDLFGDEVLRGGRHLVKITRNMLRNEQERELRQSAIDALRSNLTGPVRFDADAPFRSAEEMSWQDEIQTLDGLMEIDRALKRLPQLEE